MDAQLKKGLLEVCVLVALQSSDSYGYQIIKDVSPIVEISESTLYPILKRLEAGGMVTTYSMEHNSRLRKYYRLTQKGRQRIREFLVEWEDVRRPTGISPPPRRRRRWKKWGERKSVYEKAGIFKPTGSGPCRDGPGRALPYPKLL